MKILVPTDLSDHSLEAIRNILPEIVRSGKETEVKLFHCVEQPRQGATLMVDITKILINDAKNALIKEQTKIKEELGIDVNYEVTNGYFDVELKDYDNIWNPDLTILISKARHGIMKYLSGQQSLKFIGELRSPMLVIPENIPFEGVRKLGMAIDKSESPTLDSLAKIKKLAAYFDSEVEMFHIGDDSEIKEHEFYENISMASEFGNVEVVDKKSVREGIQLWSLQHGIDILITLTHDKSSFNRTFTGSVTKDLVKDNLLSLLVITQNK